MQVPVESHISVNLTQADLNVIAQAFDLAIKATGTEGAKAILPVLSKLENAVAAAKAAGNTTG